MRDEELGEGIKAWVGHESNCEGGAAGSGHPSGAWRLREMEFFESPSYSIRQVATDPLAVDYALQGTGCRGSGVNASGPPPIPSR